MARRPNLPPPNNSVLSEQPLVTPPVLPELPSSSHGLQLSEISRQIGVLEERVRGQDSRLGKFASDIEGVQKEASKALGFIGGAKWTAGISLGVIGLLATILWMALGSKVSTLLMIAEDRQAAERQAKEVNLPNSKPSEGDSHR